LKLENTSQINENVICILKFTKPSNLLAIDYIPIEKSLGNDFDELRKQFANKRKKAKNILKYVKKHTKLKSLLEQYDYCQLLNEPYQGIYSTIKEIEEQYESKFEDSSDIKTEIENEKSLLLKDLQVRLHAYYLKNAYEKCEKKINTKSILTYSHRRRGWEMPSHSLTQDLSIQVKTNFGYGSKSYFYVLLKYKDINIIPYSEWVIYEKANIYEIVRYSAKFRVQNESWAPALEYSSEAGNLSLTDEKSFLKKYVIDECEKMVTYLERFLTESTFEFFTWNNTNKIQKESHDLIEFRGEKISGALKFIAQIKQFKAIEKISDFIFRIEICNKKIHPILTNELRLIDKKLNDIIPPFGKLKTICEELKEKHDINSKKRSKLLNIEHEKQHFDSDKFEIIVRKGIPNYDLISREYYKNQNEMNRLEKQIDYLNKISKNISEYVLVIEDYFR